MNAKKLTNGAIRFAVSIIIIAVAVHIGSKFISAWAVYPVAFAVCLVLQEIAVMVADEIKGRKAKAGA